MSIQDAPPPPTASTCTMCGGSLAPGFLEDAGESSRGYVRWIAGPLEKGLFGGASRAFKERSDVHAYACTVCGHLELFLA